MAAFVLTLASAQETNNSNAPAPATTAAAPKVINIWPGVAPCSEQWKQKETTIHMGPMESIVNVTTPTLTAYLPDPAKATGTAVILAPGGGFLFLGTDTHEVAEWLAARGIAGFVLKYRTAPLEGETEAQLGQAGSGPARGAAHPEMAERGRAGKGQANVRGGRLAAGRKCIAAAGECLPPLRSISGSRHGVRSVRTAM